MRIGFYGGMANNMYVFAKAFREAGHEVIFVRDRSDRYPFSQPVWEDAALTLPYDQVDAAAVNGWDWWSRYEAACGWQSPAWLADPLVAGQSAAAGPLAFRWHARNRPHWQGALELLRQADVLVVCGIEGTQLAHFTGRPFVIWPHGGDVRIAAGIVPLAGRLRTRINESLSRAVLRRAYGRSLAVASQDPAGVAGPLGDLSAFLANLRYAHLPIPIAPRARLSRPARMQSLQATLTKLGLPAPQAELVLFVPSRMDFYWKRTDRLLDALALLPAGAPLHCIFSGWGADYGNAQAKVRALGREAQTTFLPCAISKPLLYEMFASVDLVVDQFWFGTYGTAMAEAMAQGAPVMMNIDAGLFLARGWEPPPVVQAAEVEQITRRLQDILDGRLDVEAQSRTALDWLGRVHHPDKVARDFSALVSEC